MNKRFVLLDLLLGFIFPLVVAYLALWRLFLVSGFVMYGDLGFPIDLTNYLSQLPYAWNWLYSSPNGPVSYISVLGFAVPYWLGLQATLAEKIWILTNYTLVGVCMYFAMHMMLPDRTNKLASVLASSLASIGYMVNMYSLALLHLPNVMLSYALFPLVVAYFVRTIQGKINAIKGSIAVALGLSIMVIFTQLFIVTLGIFALWLVYNSFCSKEKFSSFISGVKRCLLILLIFIPLNAYWLPSILIQAPPSPLTTPMIGSFAVDTFGAERGYGFGFDTVKVMSLNIGFGIVLPITNISMAIGLMLPLWSFLCLLALKNRKELAQNTLFLAIVSILGLLLSIRTPPLDFLSMGLAKYIFSSGLLWGFIRNPDHFIPLITFGYSSLTGITTYILSDIILKKYKEAKDLVDVSNSKSSSNKKIKEMMDLVRTHDLHIYLKVSAIILIMLVLISTGVPWVIYSGYPVGGDLGGRLAPITMPKEYSLLNSWIGDEQAHRSWWLPQPLGHTWFSWAPQNPRTFAWPLIVSSGPILWGSTTYSNNFLNYVYLQEVLEGKTSNLGNILSPAEVKYLAVHLDMLPQGLSGFSDEPHRLLQNLLSQKDINLLYNYSYVYLFENVRPVSPVYIAPTLGLVVGGLDTYTALTELKGFNATDLALVFADQLKSSSLNELLHASSLVIFREDMGLEDLYLQLADDSFVYPATYSEYERSPDITWVKTSSPLVYLHVIGVQSGKHFIQAGDFPVGQSIVYTQAEGASMKIPITVKEQGEYELWARILLSPIGGTLKVSIDNLPAKEIDTNSTTAFFKWVKIYDTSLSGQQHIITLENEHGINFVNVFALVPKSKVVSLRDYVDEILQHKVVVVVNRTLIEQLNLIDQESHPERIDGEWVWKNGEVIIAQTFIPTKTRLSGIEIYIGHKGDAGKLSVELREVNNLGEPSDKIIAQTSLDYTKTPSDGFYFIPFELNLTVGKKYAIVLKQEGGSSDSIWYVGRSPGTKAYDNGSMFISSDGGKTWTNSTADIAFKTFYPEFIKTTNLQEFKGSVISLYLWDIKTGVRSNIDRIPLNLKTTYILNYTMLYPGKYLVKVSSNSPFVLIIAENYDDYWTISGASGAIHFPAYSFLNGYYINKTGTFQVTIEYAMNTPFEIGRCISILSMIAIPVIVIISSNKRFHRKLIIKPSLLMYFNATSTNFSQMERKKYLQDLNKVS